MHAITIGLDIAKSVFQVHAEDAAGKIVSQKPRSGRRLARGSPVQLVVSRGRG